MFLASLVSCSMRLGVPFIAPRQLGAVGDELGRQFLPFVEWCTGQFGAQPDSPVAVRCLISLSGASDRWADGPVGAPDTEQSGVPNRSLARATHRPLIVLAIVGSSGSDSPDSSVHHRTVQ
jgi:hypothetical protein